MEPETIEVMEEALTTAQVKKMHKLIISINQAEEPVFSNWLYYILDIADVTVSIDDYTNEAKEIDYAGYYRAVYDQIKQFIQDKVDYAVDQWKAIDQPINY